MFLGQRDETMASMRAQSYYDPIAKTEEEHPRIQPQSFVSNVKINSGQLANRIVPLCFSRYHISCSLLIFVPSATY